MRSIDIKTTQNVTITYEIAALRDRILATFLDWLVIGVAVGLVSLIVFAGFGSLVDDLEIDTLMFYLILPSIFFFYTLISEVVTNGRTLGKMAMRIQVIKLDGRQIAFFDFLLRWTFRMIDIWGSLGALAAILSSSNQNGQRLGGLVSNTTVVKLNPTLNISLTDLQKINTLDNYEPKYLAIRNFKEKDMLLIKQTIERYQKYKNKAHKEAVIQLVDVVRDRLDIEEVPKKKILFLKTLIRDYIVLTR